MRKIFTSLFVSSFVLFAQAQQLPNNNFEGWKGDGNAGSTYQSSRTEMRQRPGDEPSSWQGSSINQKVSIATKKETLIYKSTSYNNSSAVKMQNKYVGALGIGANAPGFISFATPWVYAVTNTDKCDGGVYGGISFTHRPDAIKGWFKRTVGEATEKAHIIVYLWKGTFKNNIASDASNDSRDDTDRAVMGKVSSTGNGKRIASCDYEFTTTANNGWQEITVPLNYVSDEVPEKVNVIISSGDYWTRDNVKENSVLEADDVQFVYYSELTSLSYNGVSYFENGQNGVFEIPLEYDEVYEEGKLSVSSNGRAASIEKSYDAEKQMLTITVKGGDYALNSSNKHEYYVVFENGEPPYVEPELGSKITSLSNANVNTTYVLYNEYYEQYAVYNPEQANCVWAAESIDMTSPACSWMLVERDGKYYLCNVAARGYADTSTGESLFSSTPVLLSAVELGDGNFAFNATDEEKKFICTSFRSGTAIATWKSNDNGAAWQLIENPNVQADPSLVPTVTNPTPGPKPEEPEEPEPVIDYTPSYTGEKTVTTGSHRDNRWILSVKVVSSAYSDKVNEVVVDNTQRLCYNDYAKRDSVVVYPGEELTVEVNVGDGSWIHSYVYIDVDKNGFTASIAEDGYTPLEDLMSYSFYNNGGTSDADGWNSAGNSITGDARSTVVLPSFKAPETMGIYRMRVKTDWCSIDPNGDSDSNFDGVFNDYAGQIVDFVIMVLDPETLAGIENVTIEEAVKGIYDIQGRKLDDVVAPGLYIIDGKKRLILK